MNTPISPTTDTVFIAAALQSGKQGIKNTVKTGINWTNNQITKIRNGAAKGGGSTARDAAKDFFRQQIGDRELKFLRKGRNGTGKIVGVGTKGRKGPTYRPKLDGSYSVSRPGSKRKVDHFRPEPGGGYSVNNKGL